MFGGKSLVQDGDLNIKMVYRYYYNVLIKYHKNCSLKKMFSLFLLLKSKGTKSRKK